MFADSILTKSIKENSKFVLSLSNTVCDNYTNYTNKHVTKRT